MIIIAPLLGVPSSDEADSDKEESEELDDKEDEDDEEEDKNDKEESDNVKENAPGQLPIPKGTPALTYNVPSKSGDSNQGYSTPRASSL